MSTCSRRCPLLDTCSTHSSAIWPLSLSLSFPRYDVNEQRRGPCAISSPLYIKTDTPPSSLSLPPSPFRPSLPPPPFLLLTCSLPLRHSSLASRLLTRRLCSEVRALIHDCPVRTPGDPHQEAREMFIRRFISAIVFSQGVCYPHRMMR